MQCDMIVDRWRVVIEFDGNYYHRQDSRRARDKRKTEALTRAGYQVIRVRDGLEPIGKNDAVVPLDSDEVQRAKATLIALERIGYRAELHDEYLATSRPWSTQSVLLGVKPPAHRSLATCRPDIAAQWDMELNMPVTPNDVSVASNRVAHWICGNGHRFEALIMQRTDRRATTACKRCDVKARTSLTDEQMQSVRDEYASGQQSQAAIAKRYGVSKSLVSNIVRQAA